MNRETGIPSIPMASSSADHRNTSDAPATDDREVGSETGQGEREGREARRWRGRWLTLTLVVLAVLLPVWGVVALNSGLIAYRELTSARADVAAAERQLRAADLSDARETLARAVTSATAASDELRRPWVIPLRWVPLLGTNVRAASALSEAARDNGQAATEFLDVAAVIVSDDRTQEVGEISVVYLGELAPPARLVADTLTRTTAEVEQLSTTALLGPVERARAEFLELATTNLQEVTLAADLLEVMPAFLGEGQPRTYLVGAAALSEIRGSGGLLGSWSILTADEGRMNFEEFVDVDELPRPSNPVEPPSAEYAERYAGFDALRQYRNANLTPDFPSAAKVILQLWEQGGGPPVDGVVMADPVTFQQLAARSGGLEVPGQGAFGPDEILRFVALDAYEAFEDENERKRVLGATATAAFAEMFEILEDDNVPATVEMLWALGEGGHFRVYSTDEAVQDVMIRAGVAGELPSISGESVGFFTNNIGGNKVDWFERRSIDHHIELLPDGVTRATVDVTVHNGAPRDGYRRGVLGPWTEITEAGDALSLVTFSCSTSCRIVGPPGGSTDGGTERGRPMRDATVLIPAGEERGFRYRTVSEDAWRFDGGQLIFEVDHLVQPTLHGADLTVRVDIPTRTTLLAAPPGSEIIDGQVVVRATASGRTQQTYVFDGGNLDVAES